MSKRAVIYVRVSSERQAEKKVASDKDREKEKKVSPQEQEEACLKLAAERGYTVVSVYRDIERFRVGNKLEEPSGTRADRPALRRMIADGKEGLFDVIIAWKEDRLYRGIRAMLDVLDLVEQNKVGIELVREMFDPRMAGIKASIAKMELDNIKERMQMGRIGRAKTGKLLGGPGTGFLGYDIIDGQGVINESEAETVRFIFDQVAWGDQDYPGGVPIKELRRRLIAKGYRQKKEGPHVAPWMRGVIYSILNCETYLGIMTYHIDGEIFEVPSPPIIDRETYDRAHDNMQRRVKYPARNARELGFLLSGKIYGPCGHLLNYRINRYNYYTNKDGIRVKTTRSQPLAYGTCNVAYQDGPCDFRTVVRLAEVEQATWDKLAPFLLDAQNIRQLAVRKVYTWTEERDQSQAAVDRLESVLAHLAEERTWVIMQGRKKVLTEVDMVQQLGMIEQEERQARAELRSAKQSLEAGEDLLRMVNELADFLREYEGELMELAKVPLKTMTEDQRHKVQRWIDAIVLRVDLKEDNFLEIQTDASGLLRAMTNWSTSVRHH